MTILDSLPGTINSALGGMMRDATLTKVSARTSDGRGGFTNTTTTHTCKALVSDYSAFVRGQLGIPSNERKVLVLAASVTPAAVVAPGDKITIQGRTWDVVEVTSDPANATYEARSK